MPDLSKQAVQPHVDFTSYIPPVKEEYPYEGHLSQYSTCPDCGARKARRSVSCRRCKEVRLKPPLDETTYVVNGDVCRKIPLTKGFYATVDAREYDRLMLMNFSANRSKSGIYYPVTHVTVNGKRMSIAMHRFVFNSSGKIGDHRNGDGLDNRLSNLRPANSQENTRNSKPHKDKNVQYKGVTRSACVGGMVFPARITVDGEIIFLGVYRFAEGAALAYDIAARKYFGEFARLNFSAGTDVSWIDTSLHAPPRFLSTNKTGYRGVAIDCRTGTMFIASITENGKTKPIGRFKTAIEAALVRDRAARRVYGLRAILNFPELFNDE